MDDNKVPNQQNPRSSSNICGVLQESSANIEGHQGKSGKKYH